MDEIVKICPECDAEYYPHIDTCRNCEVKLLFPEEISKGGVASTDAIRDGSLICVEEGDLVWLKELRTVVEAAGMRCELLPADCGNGTCQGNDVFGLFIPQSDEEAACGVLGRYWESLHPEIMDANRRADQGLCPGCSLSLAAVPGRGDY